MKNAGVDGWTVGWMGGLARWRNDGIVHRYTFRR